MPPFFNTAILVQLSFIQLALNYSHRAKPGLVKANWRTEMNNKITLKYLPLTLLVTGLALAPTVTMADKGDSRHYKSQYSQADSRSHSKQRKHTGKQHQNSHRKNHRDHSRHNSKHQYNKWQSRRNDHAHNKHGNHNHRYNNHRGHSHTTYVVNDRHYNDHLYGLNQLRFMIGLHTDNFDITFRD